MDTSEISSVSALKKIQKKAQVSAATKMEDRIEISDGVAKMEKWLKMLHEMPEIRPEKIESALKNSTNLPALAEKMGTGVV